jgi:hypothetical protein
MTSFQNFFYEMAILAYIQPNPFFHTLPLDHFSTGIPSRARC